MKKGFVFGIMLMTLIGGSYPLLADGMDPELEIFVKKENAKQAQNALIEKFNIDTSFKFKQSALNYILSGVSRSNSNVYRYVQQNAIYEIDSNADWTYVLTTNCIVETDEVHLTVLRCKNSSDHDEEVFEFTSKCDAEDCSGVDSNSFYEKKDWLGKIEKYNESFDAWTSMNFNY